MINKIKEFFSTYTAKIIGALSVIVGILLYFLNARNKEVNSLKAKIDLANTQKEADLLEVEIKKRLENKELTKKEINELNKNLDELEAKRQELPNAPRKDSVEDYWSKN